MEELFAFLGFSAGASLAIGAVGALRRGFRRSAVGLARKGLGVGDALRRVGDEMRKIAEEARAEVRSGAGEPPAPRRRRKAPGKDVRTIEVATK
ncbi:MAG TPA: hypothetical protein VE591_04385 [Candidatus Acidoferrum sp.]|nr:hypothetical protein [Candidatus Acidoferrum sp.]